MAWNDNRVSAFDVYAQRIDPKGFAKWSNNGVAVSTAFDTQCFPVTINDGTGGAIIVWQDSRDNDKSYWDVYAQKINNRAWRRNILKHYQRNFFYIHYWAGLTFSCFFEIKNVKFGPTIVNDQKNNSLNTLPTSFNVMPP